VAFGNAAAALTFAAGITLVQLAGIDNGPKAAALPRLPTTPEPSDPSASAPEAAAFAAPAAAPCAAAAALVAKPCPVWAIPRMEDIA
jgi:hypothetical protein